LNYCVDYWSSEQLLEQPTRKESPGWLRHRKTRFGGPPTFASLRSAHLRWGPGVSRPFQSRPYLLTDQPTRVGLKGADRSGKAGAVSTAGEAEERSKPPDPSGRGLSFVVDASESAPISNWSTQ